MNANQPLTPDDPRLTAFALGELEGEQREAVAIAVAGDAALAQAVEQIRKGAETLKTGLGAAAAQQERQLSATLHEQILRRLEQERAAAPGFGAADKQEENPAEPPMARFAATATATESVAFDKSSNWSGFALPLAAGFAVLLCVWGVWWGGSRQNHVGGDAAIVAFHAEQAMAPAHFESVPAIAMAEADSLAPAVAFSPTENASTASVPRTKQLMAARPWAYLPDGRAVSSAAMRETPSWHRGEALADGSYLVALESAPAPTVMAMEPAAAAFAAKAQAYATSASVAPVAMETHFTNDLSADSRGNFARRGASAPVATLASASTPVATAASVTTLTPASEPVPTLLETVSRDLGAVDGQEGLEQAVSDLLASHAEPAALARRSAPLSAPLAASAGGARTPARAPASALLAVAPRAPAPVSTTASADASVAVSLAAASASAGQDSPSASGTPATVLAEAEALVKPLPVDSAIAVAAIYPANEVTGTAAAETLQSGAAGRAAARAFTADSVAADSAAADSVAVAPVVMPSVTSGHLASRATLPDSLAGVPLPGLESQTLLQEGSAGIPSVVVSAPGVAPSISTGVTPRLFAPVARQGLSGLLVTDSTGSRSARAAAREARQASIEQLEAAAFTNVPLQLAPAGGVPLAVVPVVANAATVSVAADNRQLANTRDEIAFADSGQAVRTLDLGNRYVQVLLWVESGHLPELARSEVDSIVRAAAVCYGLVSESSVGRQGQGLSDAQLETLEKQSALLRAMRSYLLLLSERPEDVRLKLTELAEQLQERKRMADNPGFDDLLAMIAATRALLP